MRITTILLIVVVVAYFVQGFNAPKCEHVFTEVEQSVIKVDRPSLSGSIVYPIYYWPSGIQDGKDIVCVKCFHVQKQKIDYGQPEQPGSLVWPDASPLNKICDTARSLTLGSSGSLFLKVDTLKWSKVEPIK